MPTPDPYEAYLNRAASLFDLGDIVQAGQIWQAILKRDPEHKVARAGLYKVKLCFDARATQGGMTPPPPGPKAEADPFRTGSRPIPALTAPPEPAPAVDGDRLLRDGCTLYEMGEVADALRKWEQLLAAEPGHALARTYANGARKDLGLPPLEAGAPAPAGGGGPDVRDTRAQSPLAPSAPAAPPAPAVPEAPPPAPVGEETESAASLLIREGVQLFDVGMLEEATDKWQRALASEPGNSLAVEYLDMARREQEEAAARQRPRPTPLAAATPAPTPGMTPPLPAPAAPVVLKLQLDRPAATPSPAPPLRLEAQASPRVPSLPPKAITSRPTPQRDGLKVPDPLKGMALPSWLDSPRKVGLIVGGTLAALAVALVLGQQQRERALKAAVLAARAEALKPVARQVEIASLAEAPEAIRKEAEDALGEDPLLAYFRARECVRLDGGDAKAAHLRDQARTRMASRAAGPGDGYDKCLKAGDLEGAFKAIRGLLCQSPEDAEFMAKARVISLTLAQRYAGKERFNDARDCLILVRAMYPQETIWPAKLRLLKAIEGLPKGDQAGWIPMLG